MSVIRWNAVSNSYKEVKIPKHWKITTKETSNKINCIHCSKLIHFDTSYESNRYKNEHNVGYRECKICYDNFYNLIQQRN